MPVNHAALRNELLADPASLGYAPFVSARNDTALADILNFIRNGTTPCPVNNVTGAAVNVRRNDVSTQEIVEAIRITDYTALPANPNASQLSTERRALSWLESLVNSPTVRLLNDDGSDTPVVANFQDMFGAATGTRARLLALASRFGSRAESLFGPGTVVTPADIATALN